MPAANGTSHILCSFEDWKETQRYLRAYRTLCPPQAKTTAALLLPETLRLLPLYTLGLRAAAAFEVVDVRESATQLFASGEGDAALQIGE